MTKTTLEKKWAEETESKSAIEKAYKGKKKNEAASLSPEELDKSVIDQLPAPTGWRLMVLPFKTKKVTDGGPWCQEGDWVLYARYAGSRIDIEGGEIKILNDDEIIATVSDPEAILHNF